MACPAEVSTAYSRGAFELFNPTYSSGVFVRIALDEMCSREISRRVDEDSLWNLFCARGTSATAVFVSRFDGDSLLDLSNELQKLSSDHTYIIYTYGIRRYFQHAHFIPIVGVGKRGE